MRCRRRCARDPQAGQRAQHGNRDQRDANEGRLVFRCRNQRSPSDRAENDRHERAHFKQSVGTRQMFLFDQLGNDTVFRWAKECCLSSREE